jgi:uncharacterized ferredoxin-like protein
LHERDFVSFSQVVSGMAVGEIGFEVSRSCRERDEGLGSEFKGLWAGLRAVELGIGNLNAEG